MNQTVAVTGATGFIGKYIIDNLLTSMIISPGCAVRWKILIHLASWLPEPA